MHNVGSDVPGVAISFANNFWGKDDAGVGPLLLRMQAAKQTCDELKAFYTARASIEDEYARRLLSLCKKPLGSQEMGGLKLSLDTVRGEVEAMAKQHQSIAAQMKSELEEPLAAFAGAMKERRKIVQNGIEKLLKVKMQQTQHVNKTRDKFEQESFKIKGYLAQGHMVMGQEERKNKAKLEKTQVALAASNTEYENAVKVLEETTARWNREWQAAADKFQDLEEERLDFTKSSLWAFANIASTVCVSDDASCEKIRLSLEKMDVEKDIITFITERGTGQDIPDPPKYINFIRGDSTDSKSEVGEDENYSVAQFPRNVNPAFRSSSPPPPAPTFESHHEPQSPTKVTENQVDPTASRLLTTQKQPISPNTDIVGSSLQQPRSTTRQESQPVALGAHETAPTPTQEALPVALTSQKPQNSGSLQRQVTVPSQNLVTQQQVQPQAHVPLTPSRPPDAPEPMSVQIKSQIYMDISPAPHENLKSSTAVSSSIEENTIAVTCPDTSLARSSSRDSTALSRYSNPTSLSNLELSSGSLSPTKPVDLASSGGILNPDQPAMKKRGGLFQSQSPFRRKSTRERDNLAHSPHPFMKKIHALSRITTTPPYLVEVNDSNCSPLSISNLSTSPIRPIESRIQPPEVKSMCNQSMRVSDSDQTPDTRVPVNITSSETVPAEAVAIKSFSIPTAGIKNSVLSNNHSTSSTAPDTPLDKPIIAPSKINPISGNATLALGVGGNLLPISDGALESNKIPSLVKDDSDPLALALAELKTVANNSKQSSNRVPIDLYAGLSAPTPTPGHGVIHSAKRGTPPPNYDGPVQQRLGAPPPAHTAKAMKEASEKYVGQTRSMFGDPSYSSSSLPRSGTRSGSSMSPAHGSSRMSNEDPRPSRRSASPNIAPSHVRSSSRHSTHNSISKRDANLYNRPGTSHSIRPMVADQFTQSRPGSSHISSDGMAMQLMSPSDPEYAMQLERTSSRPGTSHSSRNVGFYDGSGSVSSRQRSKSIADPSRQYSRDGRPILHFARAMYAYQAAITEELGFSKGDTLAILRHQDDGWWEAEVHNAGGRVGLVPSNYLQPL